MHFFMEIVHWMGLYDRCVANMIDVHFQNEFNGRLLLIHAISFLFFILFIVKYKVMLRPHTTVSHRLY